MSEHKVSVKWARNSTDFGYKNYNRDHVWRFDSGVEVPASAAPAYLGNPQRVDPEAAFVAALSSCHMLTFLALASNKGFVVDSYEDNAVGHVEKNANGKLAITRVDLHPNIAYGGAKQPTPADLDWLHDRPTVAEHASRCEAHRSARAFLHDQDPKQRAFTTTLADGRVGWKAAIRSNR
jgi:organic hydroperoxide reductase OsmC/OhrA